MTLINTTILDECKELPVETFDALGGKWPVDGGEFWDHRTEDAQRLCWEILANTAANAPKVCDWLWKQEDLAGFRSSMDMKSAAAAHEKRVQKAGDTIAHWSETQKGLRAEAKAAADQAKADAPSKAADNGKAPEPVAEQEPVAEAPKAKPARKPRVKQTAAA
jgi:hypothetical protein